MKRTRAVLVALACLTGVTAALWAAANEPWVAPARASRKANPVPVDDQSLAAGKVLYAKNCLSCHGATGVGNGPAAKDLEKSPGDLSKPAMWDQTDGALFWKITTGRKPMPSFETLTTETERWQTINYVRTFAPKPASSQPSSPPSSQPSAK
jgi:mono/diheme cytochrome c family protein